MHMNPSLPCSVYVAFMHFQHAPVPVSLSYKYLGPCSHFCPTPIAARLLQIEPIFSLSISCNSGQNFRKPEPLLNSQCQHHRRRPLVHLTDIICPATNSNQPWLCSTPGVASRRGAWGRSAIGSMRPSMNLAIGRRPEARINIQEIILTSKL